MHFSEASTRISFCCPLPVEREWSHLRLLFQASSQATQDCMWPWVYRGKPLGGLSRKPAPCTCLTSVLCVQTGAISESQFGKYGILRKSDLANKHSEFQAWAIEVSCLRRLKQQPPDLLACGVPAMHARWCLHSGWHGAPDRCLAPLLGTGRGQRRCGPPSSGAVDWILKGIALVASQVKKANVEALPKWEEEELLAEFMEEFNTATLPHKKYYNLEVFERERAMKAAKRGAGTGVGWGVAAGLRGCRAVYGLHQGWRRGTDCVAPFWVLQPQVAGALLQTQARPQPVLSTAACPARYQLQSRSM